MYNEFLVIYSKNCTETFDKLKIIIIDLKD